jgi:hypothetical protein
VARLNLDHGMNERGAKAMSQGHAGHHRAKWQVPEIGLSGLGWRLSDGRSRPIAFQGGRLVGYQLDNQRRLALYFSATAQVQSRAARRGIRHQ